MRAVHSCNNWFETRVLLKPVGVAGVAHYITGHFYCYFHFLVCSLLQKDLNIPTFVFFTAANVVPCGGRKTSPHTSV